jgi:prepilin-type N-terminal cleavage/methylation domain-containing protein
MKHRHSDTVPKPSLRAFTLVEVMTVVIIIGILIGLLIPVISKARIAGYQASTQNEISEIGSACQRYYDDFHAYPGPVSNSDIEGLDNQNPTVYIAPPNQPDISMITVPVNPKYPGAIGLTSKLGSSPVTLATYTSGATSTMSLTASQNLVLGLLGGLWRNPISTAPDFGELEYVNGGATGIPNTLIGTGPQTLVLSANPSYKQYTPYLPVSFPGSPMMLNGDGSPETGTGPYHDYAGRSFSDCDVPVFTDAFPDHMPILYMRARVGATGIISDGLTVNNPTNPAQPKATNYYNYDLRDITPYTWAGPAMNVTVAGTGTNKSGGILGVTTPQHGLQKVGTLLANTPTQTIQQQMPQQTPPWNLPVPTNTYLNAGEYFMNLSIQPSNISTSPYINYTGTPRMKDEFILISAGKDRAYGTADDITNFGNVEP